MKYIEMKVTGVVVDPETAAPMIMLKDAGEKEILPIWVGVMEAAAILMALEDVKPERPMTHDMTRNIITSLGSRVQKISITDIIDHVFYATISLIDDAGELVHVDSRPSDAIAVAMGANVPILVNEKVIKKARIVDLTSQNVKDMSTDELGTILENLSVEDFGKYKM